MKYLRYLRKAIVIFFIFGLPACSESDVESAEREEISVWDQESTKFDNSVWE